MFNPIHTATATTIEQATVRGGRGVAGGQEGVWIFLFFTALIVTIHPLLTLTLLSSPSHHFYSLDRNYQSWYQHKVSIQIAAGDMGGGRTAIYPTSFSFIVNNI